ncbi:hypothetical protein ACSBR1_017840 [Camellia fascicularis]
MFTPSPAFQEIASAWNVKKDLKKLEATLSIKSVLLDAEEQQEKNNKVKDWLGKLKHVFCDVEDVIDDFATEAVRRKLRKKEKSIVKEAQSFVCDSRIIGREEDKKAILEMVMEGGAQGDLSVIAIVGIGDKTTLAQSVYKNEMWVCVSNVFNLKVFVEAILKSANVECGNLEIDELQKRLRRCLDGNRYILVLDDVWNENREKWIELEDFLTSGEKGSKIVVTTRSETVARVMGTTSPYHLKGLLEDDSWSLFKQLAFRRRQLEENPSLVAIGKKILTNFGGVPLAIRTVGSLLYLKDTEIEWLIVTDKLWEIAQHETHILPTLKVSYDHLPSHLKPCFAYCSLFPKSCHIEKGTLIKLWMAQWFIHSLGKDHDLKDIADKYFNDLLFRSFFQNVYDDEDGYISFKMHGLIHDLA